MHWTISFDIPEGGSKINYKSSVFSIGSCFSTTMGEKLAERKFTILNNPFGTLFNPLSIAQVMEDSILEMPVNTDLVLVRDSLYLHFGMHSDIVAYSQDSLERLIQKKQRLTKQLLEKASHILITFGTAWVYEYGNAGQVVANCHKQPAGLFEKRLLHQEEILKAYSSFFKILSQFNKKAKVLITVSPVRHIKDGISENQLSKSILRLAAHELSETYGFVDYFPSYEIMMDELRDYRFYKEDMIHPSAQAEEYIWERFKQTWIDPKCFTLIQEFEAIKRDLNHRPFNPDSPAHIKFLDGLQKKLDRYSKDFDFSKEIDALRKQVHHRGK
ncbi:GSCFA domain-containing protein [Shivajiella indica]|uniref:GSCFA domain-containing protein n=1 Tax=Shivajiella indica TaxID=872115 RepID=A0ABW5B565_9BACT